MPLYGALARGGASLRSRSTGSDTRHSQATFAPQFRPSSKLACFRVSVKAAQVEKATGQKQVTLDTGSDCRLAVAFWPMFTYDASSGSSLGVSTSSTRDGRKVRLVEFNPPTCSVPPLDWRTTKVLGIAPLPPPIQICIETKELSGWIDEDTGQAELVFDAEFRASAGTIYQPPPLRVKTVLSTEGATGQFQSAEGTRFTDYRGGKLVGIAKVPKTGEWIMDTFLQLPNEAFALLSAEINDFPSE